MEFFCVKNWARYQHYKRRNPPWIKLYTSLLDDYDFGCLQDASKLLALFVLMLAAKANNRLPLDPAWIQKRTGLEQEPDLQPLFEHGFIVLIDASKMLAGCGQVATPETEERQTETDIQRGEKQIPKPLAKSVNSINERFKTA